MSLRDYIDPEYGTAIAYAAAEARDARNASPDADMSALDWAREMEGLR